MTHIGRAMKSEINKILAGLLDHIYSLYDLLWYCEVIEEDYLHYRLGGAFSSMVTAYNLAHILYSFTENEERLKYKNIKQVLADLEKQLRSIDSELTVAEQCSYIKKSFVHFLEVYDSRH